MACHALLLGLAAVVVALVVVAVALAQRDSLVPAPWLGEHWPDANADTHKSLDRGSRRQMLLVGTQQPRHRAGAPVIRTPAEIAEDRRIEQAAIAQETAYVDGAYASYSAYKPFSVTLAGRVPGVACARETLGRFSQTCRAATATVEPAALPTGLEQPAGQPAASPAPVCRDCVRAPIRTAASQRGKVPGDFFDAANNEPLPVSTRLAQISLPDHLPLAN